MLVSLRLFVSFAVNIYLLTFTHQHSLNNIYFPPFLQNGVNRPYRGENQRHGDADGEHLAEHDREAAGFEGGEEGVLPGELAVEDVIDDEEDRAAPEHFLQCRNLPFQRGIGGLDAFFIDFSVCAGHYRLRHGYYKTGHIRWFLFVTSC